MGKLSGENLDSFVNQLHEKIPNFTTCMKLLQNRQVHQNLSDTSEEVCHCKNKM